MGKVRLFGPGYLLALVFLVWNGQCQDCEWDRGIDDNLGLHPDASGLLLAELTDVKDPESCRKACCAKAECTLALLGFPQDGSPQCRLVQCHFQGPGACQLQPSTQFKAYLKKLAVQFATQEGPFPLPVLEPRDNGTANDSNHVYCRLPKRVGPCRAAFQKYFYDPINQTCQTFIYGGCGANRNNFEMKEECESACKGVTGSILPDESTPAPKAARRALARDADNIDLAAEFGGEEPVTINDDEMSAEEFAERCEAPPKVGPCRASFLHWYHDAKTRTCQSFLYGGCQGNKNNYETKASCVASCTGVTVLPSSSKGSHTQKYKEHCLAAPDVGPCRAALPMFYFDRESGKCSSFLYGGCRGNQNRYNTAEECMAQCSSESYFNGRSKVHSRWTAGIFLFGTLSAISVLLLGALVFIALRRNNLYRRGTSVSDKEELLTDPDRSSVESLSLPGSPGGRKA